MFISAFPLSPMMSSVLISPHIIYSHPICHPWKVNIGESDRMNSVGCNIEWREGGGGCALSVFGV